MTLFASRDDATGKITVHCTYGPVSFAVTEDASHAGHFWGELGKLLKDTEKPPVPYVEDVNLPGEPQDAYQSLGREDDGIPAE